MANWRDNIQKEFITQLNRITIVSDPDGLLLELQLAALIREKGFDIIEFNDSVEFRYILESKYRMTWDSGNVTELIVVLRSPENDINSLPFDMLVKSRRLFFSIKDIFPDLSYPVLKQLDNSYFDDLFRSRALIKEERLSDNDTKDFIISNVFKINPWAIQHDHELLHLLLHIHFDSLSLPDSISTRLIQILESKKEFKSWAINNLVNDSKFFYAFLQERWPLFLQNLTSNRVFLDGASPYSFKIPGPITIPFDHDSVRVYIDNLFGEGYLNPIEIANIEFGSDSWLRCGISNNSDEKNRSRYEFLKDHLSKLELRNDWRHHNWINYSLKLSEFISLSYSIEQQDREFISSIVNKTDAIFEEWLLKYYSSLSNLSTGEPLMVHHIISKITRDYEETGKPQALIVCDGLSLSQWFTLRKIITHHLSQISVNESSIFSWIPTLTSISRQSIFAGKIPLLFKNSITTTNSEEKYWLQVWQRLDIPIQKIVYAKTLGSGNYLSLIENNNISNNTKFVGIVINMVDQVMHGMKLGSEGMHNQIQQWANNGFLSGLISELIKYGFCIKLTSDHGNKECVGRTSLNEGALSISKGERVRIYPNEILRTRYENQIDFGLKWPGYGLPDTIFPLIARKNFSFSIPGSVQVSHGGISLEEVMVPYVEFT